jgi:hypothetical protein
MSFRRVALEAVRGFDEGYGDYGYDDVDVGLRIRHAGWRLVSALVCAALSEQREPGVAARSSGGRNTTSPIR